MRENIIQKRKISAAICEEWLERDKVLSGRQKDAIRQYVRMHTDKPGGTISNLPCDDSWRKL